MGDTGLESQEESTAAAAGSQKLRIFELALVLGVAFLPSVIQSSYDWWLGRQQTRTAYGDFFLIVRAVLSLSLLGYVLHRQGRSFRTLGLTARASDLGWALLVLFFARMTEHAAALVVSTTAGFPTTPHMRPPPPGIAGWLVFAPAAALEELVARAYLMTEVASLTGSMAFATFASVTFQTLYHLHLGTSGALIAAAWFFVFAAFYANTRRCTPLIVAHALHNIFLHLR